MSAKINNAEAKKNFAHELNQKLRRYDMSESKLAREIKVAQKSINRYCNAQTLPSEDVQKKIRGYFKTLELQKLPPGERPMTEKEIEEMEEYFRCKQVDESGEDYYEYCMKCGNTVVNNLEYYKPEAQKYILKNFEVFQYMGLDEMTFIERMRKLSEKEEETIRGMMEQVPVTIEMFLMDMDEVYAARTEYETMKRYEKRLRCNDEEISDFFATVSRKSGKPIKKLSQEYVDKFMEECDTCFYAFGEAVRSDFFDIVNKTIDYRYTDWYYLFLLSRTRLADRADWPCKQYHLEDFPERAMGSREFMLWEKLNWYCRRV